MPKKLTLATAKIRIAVLANRADYWRRKFQRPGYEASRIAAWRKRNPAKFKAQVLKYRRRRAGASDAER